MTSAAHIKIAKPDPFERLQQLLKTIAPGINGHEQLVLMIEARIGGGINTAPALTEMLKRLDLNGRHIGMALGGHNPYAGRWKRNADGIYSLID